ncbi:ABC transporter ATP-binding protein [Sodalis sp. RH21]|uniref:ABC transporter ATP-binding protein n=1 Tax=unclassified Sodalis (in: enterobacteria) TaxID=2636512 RepID=UPI0039B625BB
MAQLFLEKLKKDYGNGIEVIKELDLKIDSGEFVVVVGPSGCGKSTLLRMVAGLEEISSGKMYIDDICVNDDTPSERGIGMVFQSYALYPHMSVYKNMAFALELAGHSPAEIDRRVRESARILQLGHLLDRRPKDLSGGQRQRVAIGRAIVREPKLFLFDEPLSNLDASLRVQMRMEISALHKRLGTTILYVTHDQVEAMTLADRIVVLNQGNIEQVGTPLELYDYPANEFVAQFIGSPKMNLLPVVIEQCGEQQTIVRLDSGKELTLPVATPSYAKGQTCALGIRPEHIRRCSAEQRDLHGEVMFVEQMGNETYLYVSNGKGTGPWVLRNAERFLASIGDSVDIRLPQHACHLFGADGQAFSRLRP